MRLWLSALSSLFLSLSCARASSEPLPKNQTPKASAPPTKTTTTAPTSTPCRASPPKGFVDLREEIPSLSFQLKYATSENFTGAALPGYGVEGAWLLAKPAAALAKAQASLAEQGLGLVIFDAYRPARASRAMANWAKKTQNGWVLRQGYVASRSAHNTGNTVDLGLIVLSSGELLDMGTAFDFFGKESHTLSASGTFLENRLTLQKAMVAQGFSPYQKEWWHFSFPVKGAPAIDVAYECVP